MNRPLIIIAGGLAVAAFTGFWVYKKNRRPKKDDKEELTGLVSVELEEMFFGFIRLAELSVIFGEFDCGVLILSEALKICRKPREVLDMIHELLPSEFYYMLVEHLLACGRLPPGVIRKPRQ